MWWWLPTTPAGKISLRLRTESPEPEYIELPTGLNVDEFDVDWPWRFAQIFEFLRDDPMADMKEIRPRGLEPGDIIVAGHFIEQLNAGLVIDMHHPQTQWRFHDSAYVALKEPQWNIKIAQL